MFTHSTGESSPVLYHIPSRENSPDVLPEPSEQGPLILVQYATVELKFVVFRSYSSSSCRLLLDGLSSPSQQTEQLSSLMHCSLIVSFRLSPSLQPLSGLLAFPLIYSLQSNQHVVCVIYDDWPISTLPSIEALKSFSAGL